MMEPKVAHHPANAVVDEEAETPNESKGPETTLDSRGSLVDDMHQTMSRGLSGKLLKKGMVEWSCLGQFHPRS